MSGPKEETDAQESVQMPSLVVQRDGGNERTRGTQDSLTRPDAMGTGTHPGMAPEIMMTVGVQEGVRTRTRDPGGIPGEPLLGGGGMRLRGSEGGGERGK